MNYATADMTDLMKRDEEPCPPTTRSRLALAETMPGTDGPAPVRDDTELEALRARVERLKLENLALMRDEKAMRETKDAVVNRCNDLLADAREGRGRCRYLFAGIGALGSMSHAADAFRSLEEWSKKGT